MDGPVCQLTFEFTTGTPPREFRLWGWGWIETEKGRFLFEPADADTVLTRWREHGVDGMLDYEHQALAEPPVEAPAAGWFDLEIRADGLWLTNIRWTDRALTRITAKEYRYLSPAFEYDPKTRRILRLINVALTNLPATRNQPALIAARTGRPADKASEPSTPPVEVRMKAVLARLGLPETASESDALVRLDALQQWQRDVTTLTSRADPSEAKGAIRAAIEQAGQVETLKKELAEVKTAQVEAEIKALLDDAVKAGKATKATRDHLTEWGRADVKALRAYLAAAPTVIDRTEATQPAPSAPGAPAGKKWEDLKPVEKHNLYVTDKTVYEALKADYHQRTGQGGN